MRILIRVVVLAVFLGGWSSRSIAQTNPNEDAGLAQDAKPKVNSVVVAAHSDGSFWVNGEQRPEKDLEAIFQEAFTADKLAAIVVEVQPGVPHAVAIKIIDLAKGAGLTQFSMPPKPSDETEKPEVLPAGASPETVSETVSETVLGPFSKVSVTGAILEIAEKKKKEKKEPTWEDKINDKFGTYLVSPIGKLFFYDVVFWENDDVGYILNIQPTVVGDTLVLEVTLQKYSNDTQLPLLVLWLVIGAVFFTIRMGFINIRGFKHAIQIVRGKYDNPDDVGEVTHFQALTAALSATVGLGNIGGVAIAIGIGGPGATFWMITAGFLGMASKFTECTLGQKYRSISPDGTVLGGPMQYLSKGLAEKNWPRLGKVLAVFFVILCIGGSFAGGNAYQVNQSLGAIEQKVTFLKDYHWVYGAGMTVLVGVVIIGGIKRIAGIAEAIVPAMCGIYVSACIYILLSNAGAVPDAVGVIIDGAFSMNAGIGGLIGVVMVQGFKRAAFSNEAGVGSAAIAHSAAKSEYPVQEGIVALLEPFVDTIVVCTMTALVIVITGAYVNPEWSHLIDANNGAGLTSMAFGSEISWFPWILAVAVALFAFSTMISWSYYGERCWTWLFGEGSNLYYRIIFLSFTFLGSIVTGTVILDFGDLMILGMAFPNILGLYFLSGSVRGDLDSYWGKLKSGEVKAHK